MAIKDTKDILGLQRVGEAVAVTLRKMREFLKPGMSAKELDEYGGAILKSFRARSAPKETYGFPGYTCISRNHEVAHGIPSEKKIFQEGDLVNIDVSAELDGYWADNGGSFILGNDVHSLQPLVDASRSVLHMAIEMITAGVRIAHVGRAMEQHSKKLGFRVIRNLAGHGTGGSLHEEPDNLLNYALPGDRRSFKNNSVVAIETFISDRSDLALTDKDGWTLVGNKGGFTAQHEHTLMITNGKPVIFTGANLI